MSHSLAASIPSAHSGLSLRAWRTLRALEDCDVLGLGRCWPSTTTLARAAGLCTRTINRALAELEEAGLIQRRRTGRSSIYTLCRDALAALAARIRQAIAARRPPRVTPRSPRPPAPKADSPATPTPPPGREQGRTAPDAPPAPCASLSHRISKGAEINAQTPVRIPGALSEPVIRRASSLSAPPRLDRVQPHDLTDDARTDALWRQAAARGYVRPTPQGRLAVFAAAEHALRVGKNPPALFAALILRSLHAYATNADEQAAHERIRRIQGQETIRQRRADEARRERERDLGAAAPTLTADQAIAERLLSQTGNEAGVYAALRRHGWSAQRAEAALIAARRI